MGDKPSESGDKPPTRGVIEESTKKDLDSGRHNNGMNVMLSRSQSFNNPNLKAHVWI
jgi:hypothetical protein